MTDGRCGSCGGDLGTGMNCYRCIEARKLEVPLTVPSLVWSYCPLCGKPFPTPQGRDEHLKSKHQHTMRLVPIKEPAWMR